MFSAYFGTDENWRDYVDLSATREGPDVRYALDDTKLRALGWEPKKVFDKEIWGIVNTDRKRFVW